jgi:hypothetical protein
MNLNSNNNEFPNANVQICPSELWRIILSNLPAKTVVCVCSFVCKQWYNVSISSEIWGLFLHRSSQSFTKTPSKLQFWKSLSLICAHSTAHYDSLIKEQQLILVKAEQKLDQPRPTSSIQQARMFHPLNGRNNFDLLDPTIPKDKLPPKEDIIKILHLENSLRLNDFVQRLYL